MKVRAVRSLAPPGPNGMTRVMGLLGNSWAIAGVRASVAAATAIRAAERLLWNRIASSSRRVAMSSDLHHARGTLRGARFREVRGRAFAFDGRLGVRASGASIRRWGDACLLSGERATYTPVLSGLGYPGETCGAHQPVAQASASLHPIARPMLCAARNRRRPANEPELRIAGEWRTAPSGRRGG